MHERIDRLPHNLVTVETDPDLTLEREFEIRLVDSSTLAFRVAFSVLRHREDAEDVAQEALAKAYRSFRQLRDRERFRAWLVRMTWRMALDRQRGSGGGRRGNNTLHRKQSSNPAPQTREQRSSGRRSTRFPRSCAWSSCWRASRATTCAR